VRLRVRLRVRVRVSAEVELARALTAHSSHLRFLIQTASERVLLRI